LFAAKISFLGQRNDLRLRGLPLSEEFVDLSLAAEMGAGRPPLRQGLGINGSSLMAF
jgi:hypothetical protein